MKRPFYLLAVALLCGASLFTTSSTSTPNVGSDMIITTSVSSERHNEDLRETLEQREEDREEKSWF
ncbi:MAG: hypothetical protein AAGG68_20690 [Bacteroidota bacterium]